LELFELLEQQQYKYAIRLLHTQWNDFTSQNKMLTHLAAAFITQENCSNSQNMIEFFFKIADDQLRSNMVEFISDKVNPIIFIKKWFDLRISHFS